MSDAAGRRGPAVLVLAAAVGLLAAPVAAQPSLPTNRLLFYDPDALALPNADILAALRTYSRFLLDRGVVELSPALFRRQPDVKAFLAAATGEGTVPWFASLSVPFLLSEAYAFGYHPILCAVRDGELTYRMSLIANRRLKIRSLDEARGRRLAVTDLGLYVAPLLGARVFDGRIDLATYFSALVRSDSVVSAMLAVMFGQADVALVDRDLLVKVSEHSAAVWRETVDIFQSRPLLMGGVMASDAAPREVVEGLRRELTGDLRARPGGGPVLDAFYIDGFRECGWEDYEALEAEPMRRAGYPLPTPEQRAATARRRAAAP